MMSDLFNRFKESLGPGTFDLKIVTGEFQRITERYTKPRRHYHNLEHLSNLLTLCDRMGIEDNDIVLALFYHDVIYNPKFANNEERSAAFARRSLERVGMERGRAERVGAMVQATRDHLSGNYDLSTELFLDLDMAILGAEPIDYRVYSDGVKSEYSWIPEDLYRRNRRKFLQKTLEADNIFRTETFRKRFEEQARKNISWELENL